MTIKLSLLALICLICASGGLVHRAAAENKPFGENPEYIANNERDCVRAGGKLAQMYPWNYFVACHNLGLVKFKQQKYSEAVKAFSQAIALDPHAGVEWCNRGDAYFALSKYSAALKDFEKCVKIAPILVQTYTKRAQIFAKNNDIKSSIKEMDKYVAAKPNDPGGYLVRSSFYEKLGDNKSALSDFNIAKNLDPNIRKIENSSRLAALQPIAKS